MKNSALSIAMLLSLFSIRFSSAQIQSGYVRTVSRPDQPSQRLQGVVVRPQGEYNPVMTDETGSFQITMPGQKNGTPYALAGVNKGGYELQEAELVGRQLPFSSSVPLEIVMVSRRQLQKDKQRIEQAARENIERYYEEQLNALNEQLAQAKLSNQEYEEQLSKIEQQYDNFEPLIEQMAERYARTDYKGMTSSDSLIQQAIEQGDLQLAQERILAKGDPAEREKKIRRIQRVAEVQRGELAGDYYNLYAIHLSRFQNDSALYYLLKRAELDTTNVQWQLDAGNFYDKMNYRFDEALTFYRRALRYAIANEGPQSLHAAQAQNNVAYALIRLGKLEEAEVEQRHALDTYIAIYGNVHEMTAARMINMGTIHYYRGRLDSAQYYFGLADTIYSSIDSQSVESKKTIIVRHAELLNNMAAIEASQRKFNSAESYLRKALELLPEGNEYNRVKFLKSLGAVYDFQNKTNEARNCWQQAYEIALRIYGKDHPVTVELASYLAP